MPTPSASSESEGRSTASIRAVHVTSVAGSEEAMIELDRGNAHGKHGAVTDNPVFAHFNLVTKNMEAAVAFYRRLGLTIPDTVPEFQEHHRSVEAPGGIAIDLDSVKFARHWDHGWAGGMGVLNLTVATRQRVDEIYADLVGAG
jgi:hypothetical protein